MERSWIFHLMENRHEHERQSDLPQYSPEVKPVFSEQCLKTREKMEDLLEPESGISQQLAIGLNAHIAACTSCAQEYRRMRNLILHLDKLPLIELPTDYSVPVSRKLREMLPVTETEQASQVKLVKAARRAEILQTQQISTQSLETLVQTTKKIVPLLFLCLMALCVVAGRQCILISLQQGTAAAAGLTSSMQSIPIAGLGTWLIAHISILLLHAPEELVSTPTVLFGGLILDIFLFTVAVYWILRYKSTKNSLG